jgi:hypothetical protein
MEGYWIYNLSAPLKRLQVRRFQALKERLAELDKMYDKPGFQGIEERQKLIEKLASRFPSQEGLVLATSFGNTMRAFEDYPRVLYQFESIHGWCRIQAVMSKEYRQLIDSGRAMMDLWVNMWFVGLVVILAYVCLAACTWQAQVWWFPFVAILLTFLIFQLARDAAERWGELVKGAFDVYLPALCKKLGYALPTTNAEERHFWLRLSQAMVFRDVNSRAELDQFRPKAALEGDAATSAPPPDPKK